METFCLTKRFLTWISDETYVKDNSLLVLGGAIVESVMLRYWWHFSSQMVSEGRGSLAHNCQKDDIFFS